MSSVAVVRSASLKGFAELVRSLGGDAERIARQVGLPVESLSTDEMFVPVEAELAAMELAARELDCPDFGLRLSHYQDLNGLGPLALAIRHSPTMKDALETANRYLSLHNQGSSLQVEADPRGSADTIGLRYKWLMESASFPQAIDNALLNLHHVVLLLANGPYGLKSVEIGHKLSIPTARYEEAFDGARIIPGQPLSMLRVPKTLLDRSIVDADESLRELATFYLGQQQAPTGLATTARARAVADALMGTGRLSTNALARELDLPLRSLQRKLAEEGTSASEIIDVARRDKALEILATDLPMLDIAHMLEFSDQATLTRSARRWWGVTPTSKRRELT